MADEVYEYDRNKLPDDYSKKMEDYELEMERVGLILQTELDKNSAPIRQSHNDEVKLPRVTIPKFSGDYFKWMSFRDLFCTMVKDKVQLSDGQKMQIRRSSSFYFGLYHSRCQF